jgi:F-type H+-transporting ATPase subunit a
MAHGPMEQFKIKPLIDLHVGGYDISYTNSALFMTFAVVLSFALFYFSTAKRTMVPGRWQSIAEILYEFNRGMVKDNIGNEGLKYLPFVFTLFLFILFGNMLGLMPYAFTFTSHIVVTASLAIFIWVAATIIGFARHGFHYFSLLCPKGTPLGVAFVLVPIELMSYFIRPVSLSLRLFANMLAGHVLLKVLAGFVVALGLAFGGIPLAAVFAITLLEVMVGAIQAYVFALLTCIYLNDAVHLH